MKQPLSLPLIPKLTRLKVFEARRVEVLDAQTDQWRFDPEQSTLPLDEQANAWVEQTGALLVGSPSPPQRVVYSDTKGGKVLRVSFTMLAVYYHPAIEVPNQELHDGETADTAVA